MCAVRDFSVLLMKLQLSELGLTTLACIVAGITFTLFFGAMNLLAGGISTSILRAVAGI